MIYISNKKKDKDIIETQNKQMISTKGVYKRLIDIIVIQIKKNNKKRKL